MLSKPSWNRIYPHQKAHFLRMLLEKSWPRHSFLKKGLQNQSELADIREMSSKHKNPYAKAKIKSIKPQVNALGTHMVSIEGAIGICVGMVAADVFVVFFSRMRSEGFSFNLGVWG